MNTKDETMPEDKWEFDDSVATVFDDMLERSIPQYGVMRELSFQLACDFRMKSTDILDLGCSRGEAIARLIDRFGATNRFIGVDVSEPMLSAARERFSGMIDNGIVSIQNIDLRNDFPNVSASVVLSILTLQFTPIEYRLRILNNIYESILPGGALIIVEKVLGENWLIDDLMVKHYYELKRNNGYTQEQIDRKRLSLEGVLVPVTAQQNEQFLSKTGFAHVDCFWRWLNFVGWVAIK